MNPVLKTNKNLETEILSRAKIADHEKYEFFVALNDFCALDEWKSDVEETLRFHIAARHPKGLLNQSIEDYKPITLASNFALQRTVGEANERFNERKNLMYLMENLDRFHPVLKEILESAIYRKKIEIFLAERIEDKPGFWYTVFEKVCLMYGIVL